MKIIQRIWKNLSGYLWLDKLSVIFIAGGIILNILIWILGRQNQFSFNYMGFSSFVIIINLFLALVYAKKEILVSNFLTGAALILQIFVLIYLRYFLIIFQ